jgi:hypothetical protein
MQFGLERCQFVPLSHCEIEQSSSLGDRIRRVEEATAKSLEEDLSAFDALIVVFSLPYPFVEMIGYKIASDLKIKPPIIQTLGQNCSSLIDGMSLAQAYLDGGLCSRVLILCADAFSGLMSPTTLASKPDASDWRTAGAAVVMSMSAPIKLSVLGHHSITEPKLSEAFQFQSCHAFPELHINPTEHSLFKEIDLENEMLCIQKAIEGDYSQGNLLGLVGVNRTIDRTSRLLHALVDIELEGYFSRREIGHSGTADLVFNISRYLTSPSRPDRFVMSLNGVGYNWRSIYFECQL